MKLKEITKNSVNPARRAYDDACGLAHALELLGERWTLLVVRELMLGGRRFSELRAALPGLSANVLTQRLAALEAHGVLRRRVLPPPARVQIYELTEWGYEAGPVIAALGRWAARSPAHDPTLPISAVSVLLSLQTMFRPGGPGDAPFTVGFRFGDDGWLGRADAEGFVAGRGDPGAADICFTGAPEALVAFVYGGAPLAELAAAGTLTQRGDPALAARFASLFSLPPKFDPHA
ncbi:winged helix-turn-helix transcriptional regulator [Camelimonas sp. ID_303_24]